MYVVIVAAAIKRALLSAMVENSFLTLAAGVEFPVGVKESGNKLNSSLLICDFHAELLLIVDHIAEWGSCVFFGPTGIGKSWASMFLLWTKLKAEAGRSTVYFDSGGQRAWAFGQTRCVSIVDITSPNLTDIPELDARNTILIYDAVAGDGQKPLAIFPCSYYMFASPNAGNCKQVASAKGLVRLICPNWTVEMLMHLARRTGTEHTDGEVVRRFELFGGSPRLVVAHNPMVAEQTVQEALQAWDTDLLWHGFPGRVNQWPSKLLRGNFCDIPMATSGEEAVHQYLASNMRWDYACTRFKLAAQTKYDKADEEVKQRFRNSKLLCDHC
jgi:hypothetical protein